MGADNKFFQRRTQPISQTHFQILESSSCQIRVATEVLLDLGAIIQPKAITIVAEQTTQVHRPAPVRSVTGTGQIGQGHHPKYLTRSPECLQRQTGSPVHQSRVAHPTLVISPRNQDTSQTGHRHQSDRSRQENPKCTISSSRDLNHTKLK